jgi:hypothetical protein
MRSFAIADAPVCSMKAVVLSGLLAMLATTAVWAGPLKSEAP